MKIEHLEYFAKVAQCGSINKAAAELYISQPHLSRIIKDIEDGADTGLFLRTRAGVKLTAEGEIFLKHSLNVLNEMKALEDISVKRLKRQTLSVSMTRSTHVMEAFIRVCKHHEKEESYSFLLNEGPTLGVVDDVLEGRADIGVFQLHHPNSSEIPDLIRSKGLTYHSLAVMQPHIVISKNHELIRSGQEVTMDRLMNYGFVCYSDDHEDITYHITVEGREYNLSKVQRKIRIHGRASLLHLIAASNCYTLGIQDFEQQQPFYNIISLSIKGVEERMEFSYIVPREKPLSPVTLEFIECLKTQFSRLNQ